LDLALSGPVHETLFGQIFTFQSGVPRGELRLEIEAKTEPLARHKYEGAFLL
jgi:hypothetical protein